MRALKVAAVQMNALKDDLDHNLEVHVKYTRAAAKQDIDGAIELGVQALSQAQQRASFHQDDIPRVAQLFGWAERIRPAFIFGRKRSFHASRSRAVLRDFGREIVAAIACMGNAKEPLRTIIASRVEIGGVPRSVARLYSDWPSRLARLA